MRAGMSAARAVLAAAGSTWNSTSPANYCSSTRLAREDGFANLHEVVFASGDGGSAGFTSPWRGSGLFGAAHRN